MKRALLSVYDKTGIVSFAQELHRLDFELARERRHRRDCSPTRESR